MNASVIPRNFLTRTDESGPIGEKTPEIEDALGSSASLIARGSFQLRYTDIDQSVRDRLHIFGRVLIGRLVEVGTIQDGTHIEALGAVGLGRAANRLRQQLEVEGEHSRGEVLIESQVGRDRWIRREEVCRVDKPDRRGLAIWQLFDLFDGGVEVRGSPFAQSADAVKIVGTSAGACRERLSGDAPLVRTGRNEHDIGIGNCAADLVVRPQAVEQRRAVGGPVAGEVNKLDGFTG